MTSVLWYSNETPDVHGQGGQRRQYFQIRSLVEAGHDVTVVSLAGEQDDASIRSLTEVRRAPPGSSAGPGCMSRPRRDDAPSSSRPRLAIRVVVAHIESWMHLQRARDRSGPPAAARPAQRVQLLVRQSRANAGPAPRWRHWEVAAARDFDAVSVCSERERSGVRCTAQAAIASWSRTASSPLSGVLSPSRVAEPVMKLFGNWDWDPNRQGLTWFLDRVVPRLGAARDRRRGGRARVPGS